VTLGIGRHFHLGAGYLAGLGDNNSPKVSLVSVNADFLLLAGDVTPYVGAGVGYLSENLGFAFDDGSSAEASGSAVLFEAGLMFRRWPNYGTLEACAHTSAVSPRASDRSCSYAAARESICDSYAWRLVVRANAPCTLSPS
jgi:hypothetical protein